MDKKTELDKKSQLFVVN